MAPARSPPNPDPRAQAAPYQTRSKRTSATEPPVASPNGEKKPNHHTNDGEDDHQVEPGHTSANGSREKCTNEQSEALEALFWRSNGYPSHKDKVEVAARIGKSFHSTNVWMQNRRHPRDQTRKPWFLVPGASDPALDPTAPHYPLEGITHNSLNKKVKKEKRAIKSLTSKRKVTSKVTRNVTHNLTSIPTPIDPSDSPLYDVLMRDSVAPESPNSSGDSNGSAVSTPRISHSAEVQEETTPMLTLNNTTPLENVAVVALATMSRESIFKGILEFTSYVRPIKPRYAESSVRPWSAPDDEVTTQTPLPLLRHAI